MLNMTKLKKSVSVTVTPVNLNFRLHISFQIVLALTLFAVSESTYFTRSANFLFKSANL